MWERAEEGRVGGAVGGRPQRARADQRMRSEANILWARPPTAPATLPRAPWRFGEVALPPVRGAAMERVLAGTVAPQLDAARALGTEFWRPFRRGCGRGGGAEGRRTAGARLRPSPKHRPNPPADWRIAVAFRPSLPRGNTSRQSCGRHGDSLGRTEQSPSHHARRPLAPSSRFQRLRRCRKRAKNRCGSGRTRRAAPWRVRSTRGASAFPCGAAARFHSARSSSGSTIERVRRETSRRCIGPSTRVQSPDTPVGWRPASSGRIGEPHSCTGTVSSTSPRRTRVAARIETSRARSLDQAASTRALATQRCRQHPRADSRRRAMPPANRPQLRRPKTESRHGVRASRGRPAPAARSVNN